MTDRLQFFTHQGKEILQIDLSHCEPVEVEKILRAVPDLVTTRPRGSVLILSDLTGSSFDQEALRTLKETAVFDKPYVKKSAWVGAHNFPTAFYDDLKKFSQREFTIFQTRQEALAWLVEA